MSLHLIPASRRQFLQTMVAGGVTTLSCRTASADANAAPAKWALLADTHVDADPSTVARGANMFDHLNRIIDDVLAEKPLPRGVVINGDCAYLKGLHADYVTLKVALDRLVQAGIPVHMTMGNHDDRGPFYDALQSHRQENPLVAGKHVTVLESGDSETANLFLVDSLKQVNVVTGELGAPQVDWLRDALAKHRDKPAIVIGHHNPQDAPRDSGQKISGLSDTAALLDVLHASPNAEAYFYGHTHNWNLSQTPGHVHLINQPPCAYVFNPSRPSGWVRLLLGAEGFSVELRALDKSHPQHGEKHVLAHRLAGTR